MHHSENRYIVAVISRPSIGPVVDRLVPKRIPLEIRLRSKRSTGSGLREAVHYPRTVRVIRQPTVVGRAKAAAQASAIPVPAALSRSEYWPARFVPRSPEIVNV